MKKLNLRSPLGKVKGHGSAHEGTGHFIAQRVTAIALVPLSLWFICSLLILATNGDHARLVSWMSSGFHAGAVVLMLFAMFYHAKIGVQVVIEDYLHCTCLKIAALFANLVFMYGSAVLSILAVLKLHFHA